MEVELVTYDVSDDENYGFDDCNEQDYLNLEGERCGICSDIVIDRGVLDCCQHWFCFACIDNWATITSLCPLCQNEFQLITCVPVYDTVGGNKTDDDTGPRDDDWFIEGKTNTLSFPSYYIDENAVICLDGDSCKIRSGAVAIGDDSDIDTSIACDFCDQWYHAFCVGFEPEGTSEGSWLCPRCITDNGLQKPDLRKTYEGSLEISSGDPLTETSFSGRVSVSVADEGETAVVVSLVDQNQASLKSSESVFGCSKNVQFLSDSVSILPHSEVLPDGEPESCQQKMEFSLSQDNSFGPSNPLSPTQLKICVADSVERDPKLGPSLGSDISDMLTEDHVPESVEPNTRPEDPISAESMEPNRMEVISPERSIADEKETISGLTGFKRKQTDSSDACENPDDGEREANAEDKFSRKKIKAESSSQSGCPMDQTTIPEESGIVSTRGSSRDSAVTHASEKDKDTSIMDIVQGTERKSLKQLGHKNSSNISTRERENAAGMRLKKIMRRGGDDKDSSVLVQEIRQKIREAVRDKSSDDISQSLFDPKLLDAFRTAMAGSGAENRKPILDVKAKKALLQKGKVRESLTKKIYGAGGKRRRAWTRECEVEFWKHRCTQATKPEKIHALKSVLDLLKDNSDSGKKISRNDEEPKGSILSRVYLADASVFPRKNDIKPVSAFNAVKTENRGESGATEKALAPPMPIGSSDRIPLQQTSESQVIVCPVDGKDTKKTTKGMKTESTSAEAHRKRDSGGAHGAAPGGTKISSEKSVASASGDRRKWALELLARKTATSGKNLQDQDNDPVILKGNYPLLAQLPKDMRPILGSARHNKIPVSIRQAQLYRLAEHFLKRANLSTVCRTAETELAIADAANIEKQIADRSNSKIVYLNLCSQEILKRPENVDSDQAIELNPVSSEACEENNDSSFDPAVDEALKKAGLMSDSPPSSPGPQMETGVVGNETNLVEKSDEEGPDNVFEVESHPELDIYGDFEYNLEDDDFIGASSLNVSNQQLEQPKIKLLFSSLHISNQQSNGNLDVPNGEVPNGVEAKATAGSSSLLDSVNTIATEGSTADNCGAEDCLVQYSSSHNDEELSLAECEELYGPDKEPLAQMFPETATVSPFELPVDKESSAGENRGSGPNHKKKLGQATGDSVELSKPTTDGSKQTQSIKEKMNKSSGKQLEPRNDVMKKVEAYIKEHIRPLCKSGVITIEQYRWAVGKTTEKVMKYHAKEKNANFLIKEGEKVKKLAEQYVEASQQKPKT